MTTSDDGLVLEGCAPIPLAGYLKALGVLRLVAEQKDPEARGFWRNERFVLRTRLTRAEVVGFLANEHEPSEIVAPWNKSSGYWAGDTQGRRSVIEAALQLEDGRYARFRAALDLGLHLVRGLGLSSLPEDKTKSAPIKEALIAEMRNTGSDGLAEWIDCAVAYTPDIRTRKRQPSYAPLLGTGAIDARLDFAFLFANSHVKLAQTKHSERQALCAASIFSGPSIGTSDTSLGQFDPAAAGGYNAGVGYEQAASVNPFDIVLALEGSLLLTGGAARRNAAIAASAAAFPFMTVSLGAGSGATSADEEKGSNSDFWAPTWERCVGLAELKHLFREGRATLATKPVKDSLDFRRSVAALGTDRGLNGFQRFGFYQRAGDAHRATPIGSATAPKRADTDLIAELDANRWLADARNAMRGSSSSIAALARRLDETLFRLAGDRSPPCVQDALIAIGEIGLACARRPKLRKGGKKNDEPPLRPPPFLSAEWTRAADDGSPEFAVAAALASLDAQTDAKTEDGGFRLPFRRHLAPLSGGKGRDAWDETTEAEALVVWSGRDLVRDMADILERRLIEAQRRPFVRYAEPGKTELPLRSRRTASLAAVAAFLHASAHGRHARRIDDDRIAALAAGLAWTRPTGRAQGQNDREDILPFAFAALRPLLDPQGVAKPRPRKARKYGVDDTRERKRVDPLPLVRLLQAGRIDDALIAAQRLARGAGLSAAFSKAVDQASRSAADVQRWAQDGAAQRLAAALLIPLADAAIEALAWRAYPESRDEEETDAA